MTTHVLSLDDATLAQLKMASENDLLALKSTMVAEADDNNIYLALHPIFEARREEGDDEVHYVAVKYEILARKSSGDIFPFQWFRNLSKSERCAFTLRNFRLSKYLKKKGIHAQFNLQLCNLDDIDDVSDAYYEIAEYKENADGGLDLAPALTTDVLDKVVGTSIDDCFKVGDTHRSYDNIIALVEAQSLMLAENQNRTRPIESIKIDYSTASRAFDGDQNHRDALNEAVKEIWSLDPSMKFTVEFTVPEANFDPAYALDEEWFMGGERVQFQGNKLYNYAFRIEDAPSTD